jgi:hypothetical protein
MALLSSLSEHPDESCLRPSAARFGTKNNDCHYYNANGRMQGPKVNEYKFSLRSLRRTECSASVSDHMVVFA